MTLKHEVNLGNLGRHQVSKTSVSMASYPLSLYL